MNKLSCILFLTVITEMVFLQPHQIVHASEISTISVSPILISPANALQTMNAAPLFSWKAVSSAKFYQIQISRNSTFTTIKQNFTGPASQLTYIATTLAQGTYYWRVRAQGANHQPGPWSNIRSLVIDKTPPSPPTPTSPSDGSTRRFCTDVYKWSVPNSAFRYQIQFDIHSDFSAPIYTSAMLSSPSFSEPGATWVWVTNSQTGMYYWRIRARDKAGNWSDWSSGQSINLIDQLFVSGPTLGSPLNGTTIHNATPTFMWNTPQYQCGIYGSFTLSESIRYEIQIAENSSFTSPIWDNETTPGLLDVQYYNFDQYIGSGNVKFYKLLDDNTKYYWRVRAKNRQNEYSSWNSGSFTYVEDGSACSYVDAGPRTYNFSWGNGTNITVPTKIEVSEMMPSIGGQQTLTITFNNSFDPLLPLMQSVKVRLITDHNALNSLVDFSLISGDAQNGQWQGQLIMPESYCYQYTFDIEATTETATIPFVIVNRQP